MSLFRAYFVPGGVDPFGLLVFVEGPNGSTKVGSGPESNNLCPAGWEFVSGPSKKDPIDGRKAFPDTVIIRNKLVKYSYFETGFQAVNAQVKTNTCGEATTGSLTVTFEKSSQFEIGGGISVYGVIEVSVSGGGSSTTGLSATINVELPGTPCTEYLAQGVVEYVRIRYEHWWLPGGTYPPSADPTLRKIDYGRKGFFPRINYVLCKSKCEQEGCDCSGTEITNPVTK